MVLDVRAIRLMVDLVVAHSEDPMSFSAAQREELVGVIVQNMGRPTRGDNTKRVVIVLLNCDEVEAKNLVSLGKFADRAEFVGFKRYADLSGGMFLHARTWLEGDVWPDYDPEEELSPKNRDRHQRHEDATTKVPKRATAKEVAVSRLRSEARVWKETGGQAKKFLRKHNIRHKDRTSLPGILKQMELIFGEDL